MRSSSFSFLNSSSGAGKAEPDFTEQQSEDIAVVAAHSESKADAKTMTDTGKTPAMKEGSLEEVPKLTELGASDSGSKSSSSASTTEKKEMGAFADALERNYSYQRNISYKREISNRRDVTASVAGLLVTSQTAASATMQSATAEMMARQLSIYREGHSEVIDCLEGMLYLYTTYVLENSISAINVSYECRLRLGQVADTVAHTLDCIMAEKLAMEEAGRTAKRARIKDWSERMTQAAKAAMPAFDDALTQVFRLLSRDSFNRFCGTDEFRQMLLTSQFSHLIV